jgi:fructose-1,6-bisphosphatase-3
MAASIDPDASDAQELDLSSLRSLARQFQNIDCAMSEIARLSAVLTLPKGTIHVISDVHGEDKKLRHVINNASGTLRPLIEKLFAKRMTGEHLEQFLKLCFYPAEVVDRMEKAQMSDADVREYAMHMLPFQLELVRHLLSRYSLRRGMGVFPAEYYDLLLELLNEPTSDRGRDFLEAIVDELLKRGRLLNLIHVVGRLVRNLAIHELILAGDCWDRGPRGDRVVDYLRQQPNVSFVWGNHDAGWIGAGLGHDALICHVLRVSLRYRRMGQLDEGYSIPLTPLDHLARTVYGKDPATQFFPAAEGMRPKVLVARMQKAAAVMQFKLEGQVIARNPQWKMDHRRLLHRIDHENGTITIDGHAYPLKDTSFPTIDKTDPYKLSPEEQTCLNRIRQSFLASQKLAEHVKYVTRNGSMHLVRDGHLIFHGCVPTDEKGEFLSMPIDGKQLKGRELFNAIERVVLRAVDQRRQGDMDLLWYLWCGPMSPLFGKDRITTFERDFIEDKHAHHETKDPYFNLIHETWFCDKVLKEFGVDPDNGLIVNGHVPVKIEAGESPLKRSGKAITIDGAFSEAYGDHGYTLVLEADRTVLARHHHFDSVEAAIREGVDIVPKIETIRSWPNPHRISDTERGTDLRNRIALLERLIEAYRNNDLRQNDAPRRRR